MKRGVALCLVAVLLFLFCSCSAEADYVYDPSVISEVRFVWAEENRVVKQIEVLPADQLEVFCADLNQLDCHEYWNDPVNIVDGSAIEIRFENGDYRLLNHYCTIRCENGETDDTWRYYGYEEFVSFWERYCTAEYLLP